MTDKTFDELMKEAEVKVLMETLETLKNEYAQEQGYEDWEHLLRKNYWSDGDIEVHWTEICIRAGGEGEKKTDNVLKITDRQITHLREEISRVQKQIHLIKEGKTQSGEKDRMDIVVDCCKEIDRVLREL